MAGPAGEHGDRSGRDHPGMSGHASSQAAPAGDQPIDDLAQDELGRDRFVAGLQDEVRNAPSDGFVIGVTGDWGSGKTSVINMALNPLAKEGGFRLVRFNPWLFSGTPQLIEHFFTELSAQLREAGRRIKGERLVRLSEAISGYADILDPLRFAPGVDAAVRAVRASAGILGRLGHKPTSAVETKAALDRLLAEHDERLVIVVDDIDRLTDPEIRDVMRLVRLVGDFPNTTYVLAYSSAAVAQALGGGSGQEIGQAYLEKIVQVTHAVPAIDPDQLSQLLFGRLEGPLTGLVYELEREHWSSIGLPGTARAAGRAPDQPAWRPATGRGSAHRTCRSPRRRPFRSCSNSDPACPSAAASSRILIPRSASDR